MDAASSATPRGSFRIQGSVNDRRPFPIWRGTPMNTYSSIRERQMMVRAR